MTRFEGSSGSLSRRSLLVGGAGMTTLALVPQRAMATPERMAAAIDGLFEGRTIQDGRVNLTMPPIAENGNSVSLEIDVDSAMTTDDHVRQIAVFAERNPLPDVARFTLGPRAGRARIATRIRMNDTQNIVAIAEMADGSLWAGRAETVVTLAACIIF